MLTAIVIVATSGAAAIATAPLRVAACVLSRVFPVNSQEFPDYVEEEDLYDTTPPD